ncbi:MAG: hypothetical protein Q9165_007449, partial [Trypethelium subeluteriae]
PDESRPLLVTAGAGRTGLNLPSTSIVIQLEVWWNSNTEVQAARRCWHQRQEKAVWVIKLWSSQSAIDVGIYRVQKLETKVINKLMKPLFRRTDEGPQHVTPCETPGFDTRHLDTRHLARNNDGDIDVAAAGDEAVERAADNEVMEAMEVAAAVDEDDEKDVEMSDDNVNEDTGDLRGFEGISGISVALGFRDGYRQGVDHFPGWLMIQKTRHPTKFYLAR